MTVSRGGTWREVAPAFEATRAVLDAYPSASLALDLDGRIRMANGEVASMLSRSTGELEGLAFETLLPERHRAELRSTLRGLNAANAERVGRVDQLVSFELPGRRELNAQLAFAPLASSDGRLVLVSLFDVGASRAIERETTERLRSIFEHAAQGIFLIRVSEAAEFFFEDWNAETERWTGVSRSQVRGLRPRDFLPPDEATRVEAQYQRSLDAGQPISYEERPGSVADHRIFHTTLVPIRDTHGRIHRLLGMSRDITDQKNAERAKLELEAQLRQAHKLEALGTLAGGIAHDFNNLLGVMIALTDLIEWEQANPAQVRLHLDDMRGTTRRASELVRQILSFSRRQKLERRPLRLQAPVQDALKLLRATLPATLQIEVEIEADAPLVLADPTQIDQVLVNLATNAAHAMGERQGHLWVRLGACEIAANARQGVRPGRYLRLCMRDDGAGMDAPTRARVFEPFFTTKPAGQGTGLGLTIVQGIVAEHEGHISLESELGRGASFEILLPEYALETSEIIELAPDVRRGRGETVLLIDDERHLCESLFKLLEKLGYSPTGRTDPVEALELVRVNPGRFDVVLTDLRMPSLSGVDLARAIQALPCAVPLVMMTGFSGNWTAEALQSLGVARLVSKPVSARELSSVLRDVLDRSRFERQSA
jgi:PAS domain S-box-containing protein